MKIASLVVPLFFAAIATAQSAVVTAHSPFNLQQAHDYVMQAETRFNPSLKLVSNTPTQLVYQTFDNGRKGFVVWDFTAQGGKTRVTGHSYYANNPGDPNRVEYVFKPGEPTPIADGLKAGKPFNGPSAYQATGRPQVTIQTAHVEKFRAILLKRAMEGKGTTVVRNDSQAIAVTMPTGFGQAILVQAFLGNSYSSTPVQGLTLFFVPDGAKTTVYASSKIEMRGVFGQDQGVENTKGTGAHLQTMLNGLKLEVGEKL